MKVRIESLSPSVSLEDLRAVLERVLERTHDPDFLISGGPTSVEEDWIAGLHYKITDEVATQ